MRVLCNTWLFLFGSKKSHGNSRNGRHGPGSFSFWGATRGNWECRWQKGLEIKPLDCLEVLNPGPKI